MHILDTERLTVRRLTPDDAPFILELLNDPPYIRFIADRNVRSIADAENYIRTGPQLSYDTNGFGLYLVALKADAVPIGICGMLKRPTLEDADIGYALLSTFPGHGYAFEAARAVIDHEVRVHRFSRIVAITNPDNERSGRLLEKLGLQFERMMPRDNADPNSIELKLYSMSFAECLPANS